MYREYNKKISYVKECIQKRNKLKCILKQTEQDLIREKLQFNKLLEELQNENLEVLNFKSDDIVLLFHKFLGNRGECLYKEKFEVLKTRFKYDQSINNVDYLVEKTKCLVDELSGINECEEEYDDLINKKLEFISLENKETNAKIKKLINRRENIIVNISEVEEAILAGQEALETVEKVISELKNDQDWGEGVCRARDYAEKTQRQLGDFKRQINDINMITSDKIAVAAFETFTDSFFEGLIFDWAVQGEIRKSLDSAKNLKNCLDVALSKLYEEKVTEEFMYQQMEDKIKQLIDKG
jgi:hypothetical protein